MQIISSSFLKKNPDLEFEIEDVQDPSKIMIGTTITWVRKTNKRPIIENSQAEELLKNKKILVIILPGLTGGAKDSYIHQIAGKIIENGYAAVIYNYRLLSPNIKLVNQQKICLYNDLKVTLQYIKKNYPQYQTLFAVGHSYGANQLINYLGREKENSLIKAAVSVANPYDQLVCHRFIKRTIYDYLLARMLAKKLEHI